MEFQKTDFESVSTKSELYAALDEYFPDFTRTEIREVVTRSPALAGLLDELDLFDLL